MQYRKLGQSDIEATAIGLGTWAIGGDSQWGHSDDRTSIYAIQEAIDQGITLIDTAPAYGLGHSEEVVGKAIEGKRHDAATGKDIITFTVKDQEGAPFRRTGTISLMAPEKYLNNFVQVNQGFASRSGSNFSFLQYGSANPLEGLGGRLISLWTEAQADEGWSSTKGPGLDEAYCYGRNGFIQLGDDASHGADLISPYNSNFYRDTVLLVYFDAVAYADKDGVKDDVTLTVEVTGGGEFSDGSKVKTVKVPNLDPNAEELAKSMWTNVGNRFYVVSKPGNMLSSSTRIRVMDGEYTNASPSRVFIDNFYLFTINREHWDNLIGGLAWVDQLEKDK